MPTTHVAEHRMDSAALEEFVEQVHRGYSAADPQLGLRAALAHARAGLADARARVAALPADFLRPYAAGAARIRDQLGPVFGDVGAALGRPCRTYSDKALNDAFEDQPECGAART